MKREIPQKVNAKFGLADQACSASVGQFCAGLFRRTRSASLLSFTLTAGTLGLLLPSQKAAALPVKDSALLSPVSSLPHLFNSADAPSRSYSSSHLDLQSDAVQVATGQPVNPSFGFQSNDALSARLSLQVQPETLSLTPSADDSVQGASQSMTFAAPSAEVESISISSQNGAGIVATESSGLFIHRVRTGENLTEIAQKYSVSPEIIAQTNRIPNPNVIEAHEDLVIPSVSLSAVTVAPLMVGALAGDAGAVVQAAEQQGIAAELLDPEKKASAESLPPAIQAVKPVDLEAPGTVNAQISEAAQIAMRPQSQKIEALGLNDAQSGTQGSSRLFDASISRNTAFPQVPILDLPTLVSVEQFLPSTLQNDLKKYIWPAHGVFTSGYGWRWGRMHKGIDIAAPVGTPVVSAASGVVMSAGWNDGGYGNLVEIRHPDGSVTVYAHNNRILTRVGAIVSQGEMIAQMGSTGRSTGPHSHFEIRPRGSGAVDPLFFLSRS